MIQLHVSVLSCAFFNLGLQVLCMGSMIGVGFGVVGRQEGDRAVGAERLRCRLVTGECAK